MYSNISNQNIFVNNEFVSGVSSLNFSYDTVFLPSLAIDDSGLNFINTQPIRGNLSLELLGNSNDPFINYTGNRLFSGRIEYGDKYFNFSSGALTRYAIRYTDGSPISTSISATLYGEVANITGDYTPINRFYDLPIYNYHYIDLDLDEILENRTNLFEISIRCERAEKYEIGDFLPSTIQLIYPIEISFNFDFEIDKYKFSNIRSLIQNTILKNLNIKLRDMETNSIKRIFNFNNLILNNQGLTLSSTENAVVNMSYSTMIVSGET